MLVALLPAVVIVGPDTMQDLMCGRRISRGYIFSSLYDLLGNLLAQGNRIDGIVFHKAAQNSSLNPEIVALGCRGNYLASA